MSETGSQSGFTLIELLVVIAILVMMASAFPLALDRALPGRRVTTSLERLQTAVREAQALSLSSGAPIALRLTESGIEATAPGRGVATDLASFPRSSQVTLHDTDGHPSLEFIVFPDGSCNGVRYDIADGNHRGTLFISGLTCRTRIERATLSTDSEQPK
jgi:type II secretion system protein H